MYRSDALTTLCNAFASYRAYQAAMQGTFGPVREAWERKVNRSRAACRSLIFAIRANDYEGTWA